METENPAKSWRVEVIADNSGKWVGNGLNFPSEDAAKKWGEGLFMRWTAVREYRVVTSENEPNTDENGKLK